MSYGRMSDPIDDYNAYSAHQQSELDKLPKCENCGEPIQDERLCDFDGTIYCLGCVNDNFVKYTEDYIE